MTVGLKSGQQFLIFFIEKQNKKNVVLKNEEWRMKNVKFEHGKVRHAMSRTLQPIRIICAPHMIQLYQHACV